MPTNRPSGAFSPLLPLAFLCAVLGACEAGGATGAGSPRPDAQASGSGRVLPLPEPFDSTGCYFHGATYQPLSGSGGDELHSHLLKIGRLNRKDWSVYDAKLVFQARDRRSGELATSLEMVQIQGVGLARHGAFTDNEALSVDVLQFNRDLTDGGQGDVPQLEIPAPYVLEFHDLQVALRNRDWDTLGGAATFHTRARSKPDFRNRWLLKSCGGR